MARTDSGRTKLAVLPFVLSLLSTTELQPVEQACFLKTNGPDWQRGKTMGASGLICLGPSVSPSWSPSASQAGEILR